MEWSAQVRHQEKQRVQDVQLLERCVGVMELWVCKQCGAAWGLAWVGLHVAPLAYLGVRISALAALASWTAPR